jgi:exonuclease SbcD
LLGLTAKSELHARRVEEASRQAFTNLVDLAIEQGCRFVIFAGDLFDGQLRNFQTGLFFLAGMKRLKEAGIRAFIVLGNHDAENQFASRLAWSDNVHLFSRIQPETVVLVDVGVAIHGQSFSQRDVIQNIARDYPSPRREMFNIGVLHTACQGHEGTHAVYAPCTVEQLVNHGYDYWALGHVHGHAVLNEHPHVVYPGNLQGRHAREGGAKGAVLVDVRDGAVTRLTHRSLDVVRWASETIDVSACRDRAEVLAAVGVALRPTFAAAGDRLVALRLRLVGQTEVHGDLALNFPEVRDDVDVLLSTLPGEAWLEKLDLATSAPAPAREIDPTVAGRLAAEVGAMAADASLAQSLEAKLTALRARIPDAARPDELFARLRAESLQRAGQLALSLLTDVERFDASR